jgi:hypothetical protein
VGMDVYGKNPTSEVGEYFRASVWSWYPILDRVAETGVLPAEMVERMGSNDGAGPDAVLAGVLADALDAMVRGLSDDGVVVSTEDNTERGTAAVVFGLMSALSGSTVGADFSTSVGHLREFAAFCRASGGFEVC